MMMGFTVVIVLMSVVSVYMVYELEMVSDAAHITLTSDIQSIDLAKQLRSRQYEESRSAEKYLILRDNAYFAVFEEENQHFSEDLDSLIGIQSDPQKIDVLQIIRVKHDGFARALYAEQARLQTATKQTRSTFDQKEFLAFETIQAELTRFVKMNQTTIEQAMAGVEMTTKQSASVAVVLTFATLLIAVGLALFITRTITRPINAVIEGTQQIARGSFEQVRVASHDETALLADAVNAMSNQLKQINEYKASMMRQISHELRTPLQTILSAQYILSEQKLGQLNPDQLRLLGSMRGNVDKLIKFTNAFLDIAKIEAGKMEYELVLTDLLSVVAASIEDAQVLAERKGIDIGVSASPIPYVLADVEKLSQVFSNLVSNAIKYTDKGGKVTITVERNGNGARVSIADTGIGIAKEDQPKIFTKFYQASNASKAGSKGTGLGLALVKAFVEGHGGTVTVSSAVGSGSTFMVDLPAADLGSITPSTQRPGHTQKTADGTL
jgi:signal transduction histidine kinase